MQPGLARHDRLHDGHAGDTGQVVDDVVDLEIHLVEALVHVPYLVAGLFQQAAAVACETADRTDFLRWPEAAAQQADAVEMLEAAGVKNVKGRSGNPYPGRGIHEMGTARMGKDPKTSVLNSFNQVWDAKNVFVTDGSFMVSAACVNPSLTYMAFTARAVDHAVKELKKGNI